MRPLFGFQCLWIIFVWSSQKNWQSLQNCNLPNCFCLLQLIALDAFQSFFAVVQLPIYIFTISNCWSIGIHSNQPMKINFYHLKLPNFFMIKARNYFGKNSNKMFWLDPYMQCRYGRCLKKMLDLVQKCRRGYRGCCSVQDWLADFLSLSSYLADKISLVQRNESVLSPKESF